MLLGLDVGDLYVRRARADAMFLLLVRRTADLQVCREGSPDAEELEYLAHAIDAYEAKRFGDN